MRWRRRQSRTRTPPVARSTHRRSTFGCACGTWTVMDRPRLSSTSCSPAPVTHVLLFVSRDRTFTSRVSNPAAAHEDDNWRTWSHMRNTNKVGDGRRHMLQPVFY
ncbi:hypothetical protein VPH35_025239 [Triticum aestivum]